MSGDRTTARPVAVGDTAPDFTLLDSAGAPVRLRDLLGRGVVVLYFYPKDDTPGCRAEACAFRDSYDPFREAGAEVVGVSSDPVAAHERFTARHALPFPLLSDADGAVRRRYGVPATLGLLPGRVTYVIDRDGIVRHRFSSQFAATRHVQEALQVVRTLNQRNPDRPPR